MKEEVKIEGGQMVISGDVANLTDEDRENFAEAVTQNAAAVQAIHRALGNRLMRQIAVRGDDRDSVIVVRLHYWTWLFLGLFHLYARLRADEIVTRLGHEHDRLYLVKIR